MNPVNQGLGLSRQSSFDGYSIGASTGNPASLNTDSQADEPTPDTATQQAQSSSQTAFERLASAPTALEALASEPTTFEQLGAMDAVNDSIPNGLSGAAQGLASTGVGITTGNPELTIQYETTRSAVTGKGGINPQALEKLEALGFEAIKEPNNIAPGSLTKSDPGYSNTHNGDAARDAIAERYLSSNDPNVSVRVEVKYDANNKLVPPEVRGPQHNVAGDRNVDVKVDIANPSDPRYAKSIEIESKAYRLTPSNLDGNQIAQDAERLNHNKAMRGAGFAVEGIGKVVRPIGLVLDTVDVGSAIYKDGGIGLNTGEAASRLAGGAVGGWGGASAGAVIGTAIFPGVGTVVGGVLGAAAGAWGGDAAGRGAFATVRGWFD